MKKRFLAAAVLLLAAGTVPASAATMTVSLAKTTGVTDNEKVAVTITNFPTKAGIYLQQCLEPAAGARPTVCNRANQLWITTAMGGSFKPTDAITMNLVASFDGNDCTKVKCGVFTRLDHTAPGDTSEDMFIPVTFAAAGPATTVPAPLAKQTLKKLPVKVKVGAKLALPLQTSAGATVSYRTASPKTCTVAKNVVSAVKVGNCKLQAYAPATDKADMFTANLMLKVVKR